MKPGTKATIAMVVGAVTIFTLWWVYHAISKPTLETIAYWFSRVTLGMLGITVVILVWQSLRSFFEYLSRDRCKCAINDFPVGDRCIDSVGKVHTSGCCDMIKGEWSYL